MVWKITCLEKLLLHPPSLSSLLTSQIRIRVGEYDFSNAQEELPHVERSVTKKIVHPKYNFFTYEYDLALVQLEKAIEFAPHISPICLPGTDDLLVGERAVVTGWGRLSEGGTLPSVLQEVSVLGLTPALTALQGAKRLSDRIGDLLGGLGEKTALGAVGGKHLSFRFRCAQRD